MSRTLENTLLDERSRKNRQIENQAIEIRRMAVQIADQKRIITRISSKRNIRQDYMMRLQSAFHIVTRKALAFGLTGKDWTDEERKTVNDCIRTLPHPLAMFGDPVEGKDK